MIATQHAYIIKDEEKFKGEPHIRGTRITVRTIIENVRLGIAPQEIPEHFPHLNLAQVYDAMSYYYDHQEEVDDYIERNRIPADLIGKKIQIGKKIDE